MYDNQTGGVGRCVCRLNTGLSVFYTLVVGVLLLWGTAHATTDEFAKVQIGESANASVQADSQPLAAQNLDASELVDANDKVSRPIDTAPDLSDVVQLDTSKVDQHSQLDLAGSRDMQNLDAVDTASSVKFTQTVDDIGGDIDDQPVAVSNAMIEQVDAPLVAVASVKLPVTNTADAHSQASDADSQLKDASNDAASEENAGLPYAVVLALLALIGLVPVARRNDQHHV